MKQIYIYPCFTFEKNVILRFNYMLILKLKSQFSTLKVVSPKIYDILEYHSVSGSSETSQFLC